MKIFEKIAATPETLADWICGCFCCGNSEDAEARKEEMIEYFNQEAADEEHAAT